MTQYLEELYAKLYRLYFEVDTASFAFMQREIQDLLLAAQTLLPDCASDEVEGLPEEVGKYLVKHEKAFQYLHLALQHRQAQANGQEVSQAIRADAAELLQFKLRGMMALMRMTYYSDTLANEFLARDDLDPARMLPDFDVKRPFDDYNLSAPLPAPTGELAL